MTRADDPPRTPAERAVVVVAALASFLTPFMGSSINVAFDLGGMQMIYGEVPPRVG